MSLPNPIITVLAHFEPLFTAQTWKRVVTLLVGTLLARGRRTVTAALRQMGLQREANFGRFRHVLNRARWSAYQSTIIASSGEYLCAGRSHRGDRD